jgi:tetratricopeptide (TPR) repeat protein
MPPVASAPPAPSVPWGLPPPTIDAANLPGMAPAAWDSPPADAEMSMMGSTDFGRTRRLVGFLVVAAIAAALVAAIALNNRTIPLPPPPAEPAAPAVTVKPTTPVRPRDPAFDTATSAAEFAVAGERAHAQKRLEDAEELFQAAIVREPKHVGALLGLGRMRGEANDWPKAAAYYQRAVNSAPKDGTARIALGDAYVKLGKIKDARREYKKAKQLGHPEAAAKSAAIQ